MQKRRFGVKRRDRRESLVLRERTMLTQRAAILLRAYGAGWGRIAGPMDEILSRLPAGSRVLDLACATGSFDARPFDLRVIRLDAAPFHVAATETGVQADASALPFRSGSIDAVICNHGLEHFPNLDAALAEIGRVVKSGGAVYISVPDCTTLPTSCIAGCDAAAGISTASGILGISPRDWRLRSECNTLRRGPFTVHCRF